MARWSEKGWKNIWWKRVAGKVYDREEWKKLLRMAWYRCILPIPMECVYARAGILNWYQKEL
jgi:hypothetical protein